MIKLLNRDNIRQQLESMSVRSFIQNMDTVVCKVNEIVEMLNISGADPAAVLRQIMWERDVAIEQLKSIGKGLGEKMDDVVKVVRCKDCKYRKGGYDICELWLRMNVGGDEYCSYGVRKDNDEKETDK